MACGPHDFLHASPSYATANLLLLKSFCRARPDPFALTWSSTQLFLVEFIWALDSTNSFATNTTRTVVIVINKSLFHLYIIHFPPSSIRTCRKKITQVALEDHIPSDWMVVMCEIITEKWPDTTPHNRNCLIITHACWEFEVGIFLYHFAWNCALLLYRNSIILWQMHCGPYCIRNNFTYRPSNVPQHKSILTKVYNNRIL